ncbi:unnamed protein product [Cochlearia groenlandica]
MAFLFVFFPENSNDSSSSSSSPAKTSLFRFRSSRLLLLSKAKSTISICLLLFLITLFIFTLSSFEPNPSDFPAFSHRRYLLNRHVDDIVTTGSRGNNNRFALQGMGTLFLRGNKAMHNLIVAHVVSDTTEEDLRLFLRLIHRSGVISKSDVVLLFDSPSSSSSRFVELIEEENKSFFKLAAAHRNSPSSNKIESIFGFNISQFMKKKKKEEEETTSEPIWGKKTKKNESTTELTHGSVVSFDVNELDPENSLSGFIEEAPISLRRWACYPLLLGRIRRSFKHVLLVDAKTSLIVGDPFTRIRNRSSESVLFFPSGDRKRVAEINPAVLIGGAKGIRGLASTMHTEIVSTTMKQLQDKRKKNSVVESVVLSQLVGSVYKDKGFKVVVAGEFVVEASSLAEFKKRNSVATSSSSLIKEHDIIQRGINDNI